MGIVGFAARELDLAAFWGRGEFREEVGQELEEIEGGFAFSADGVYRKVGLSRTESAELVEAVLDEICEAIVRGETVKLSSFATFHVRSKNERIGRNPKTGEEVPILPRRVMTFKSSNVLKSRILRAHQNSKARGGK